VATMTRVSRTLRLALVVVGLAVAVYGVAALTGCWLGEPPWWPQLPESWTLWHGESPSVVLEGRAWIGVSVTILGVTLALAASAPRLVGYFLGSALAVYAVASLTGAWLGEPPWWRTKTEPVEVLQLRERAGDYEKRLNASSPTNKLTTAHEWDAITGEGARLTKRTGVDFRFDGVYYPRPGREWISGGVVAAGLGLAAVGAWPRRRRREAPP
jgi:hypothetical protein